MAWRRDGEGEATAFRYLCKSWRCDQGCACGVAREDYRRIEAGATSQPDWIYGVLTVDPRAFRDRWAAFRAMGDLWAKRLRRRLEREYGRLDYIQTWEQHRSGYPHGNLLFRSDALLAHVRELGVELRTAKNASGERPALFPFWRKEFRRFAIESGFGRVAWAELIEPSSAEGMAAYLAKHTLAGELTRSHMKHGDQRPMQANRNFHRLRSSLGLLPPRKKSSGLWTGFLAKTPLELLVDRETGDLSLSHDDVERLWIAQGGAVARAAVRAWRERFA